MDSPLTSGWILQIMNGSGSAQNSNAVVQVLNMKKISGTDKGANDRWRMIISDGVHFANSMLATQSSPLCDNGVICKHGLIRINKYIVNNVKGKKILILLEPEALTPNDANQPKYGNPTNVEEALGNTDASSAAAPPTTSSSAVNAAPAAPQASHSAAPPPSTSTTSFNQPPSTSAGFNQAPVNQRSFYGGNPSNNFNQPPKPVDDNRPVFPIASLSPYQNKWTIRARAMNKSDIRTWSNQRGEGRLFSITFMDESGEIRATAFNDQCDAFFPIIDNNGVYLISGASIKVARNRQYSNVNNEYEMTLDSRTEIVPCGNDPSVPTVKFEFRGLNTLMEVQKDATIDVIGVVKDVHELTQIISKSTQRPIPKRDITLVDDSRFSVRATLWGKQAENFDATSSNPIIAIKGVKVGDYGGRTLSVMNNSTVTINPDIPESHRLRGWFDSSGRNETSWQTYNSSMGGMVGQAGPGGDVKNVVKPIGAIKSEGLGQGEKPDYVNIRGVVMHIKEPLSYPACPGENCSKKVVEESPGHWRCERCNRSYPAPEYRYIMSLSVSDSTDQVWVQAFNEQGEMLMGKSAGEVQEIKNNDPDQAAALIQDACFQRINFRVRAKTETYNDESKVRCTVMSMHPTDFCSEGRKLIEDIEAWGRR